MKTVYVPWTLAAIRRKPRFATIKSSFHPDTRLIVVSNRLASLGAMLHWNPRLRALEAVPYRTPRR